MASRVVMRLGWAGLGLMALLIAGSCKKTKPTEFQCYQVGDGVGVNWRECAPELMSCKERGCFEREQAYCFPIVLTSWDPAKPDRRGMVCTPTEKECREWYEDRLTVPNHPLGTCTAIRADEYPAQ